jgi:hypothetical protein
MAALKSFDEIRKEMRLNETSPSLTLNKEPKKGFLSRFADHAIEAAKGVGEQFEKRGAKVGETFGRAARGEQNPLSTGLQVVGQAAGAVGDVVGEGIMFAGKEIYDTSAAVRSTWEEGGTADVIDRDKKAFAKAGQTILNTSMGKEAVNAISQGVESWNQFKKTKPVFASNLEAIYNVGDLATIFIGGAAAKKGITKVGETGFGAAQDIAKAAERGLKQAEVLVEETGRTAKELPGVALIESTGQKIKQAVKRTGTRIAETSATAERQKAFEPAIKKAIDSGLSEDLVLGLKELNPATIGKAKEMIDAQQIAVKSTLKKSKQAKDILGREVLKPAEIMIEQKSKSGKTIGKIRKAIKGKPVDITDTYETLKKDIVEMTGAIIKKDGVSLRGGKINTKDKKLLQDLLVSLAPKSKAGAIRHADFLDNLRAKLFDRIKSAKLRQEPFTSAVDTLVDRARGQIAGQIDNQAFQGYQAAAQEYAEISGSLKEFVKLIGYKGKLDNLTKETLNVGEKSLRQLGNAASSPEKILNNLFETATKYGYTGGDDLYQLTRLADIIENLIGSAQTRNLASEVGRGVQGAGGLDFVSSTLKGAKSGGFTGAGASLLEKFGGVGKEDQIKALKELFDFVIKKEE